MFIEITSYLGAKLLDKVLDDSLDSIADKYTRDRIKNEYEKLKVKVLNNLLTENIDEPYFESLQRLLAETGIVKLIFNLSYLLTNISEKDKMQSLDNYVNDYFSDKEIGAFELSIIKGKIKKQYEYCFNVLNEPSDESRKLINQLVIQILNAKESQTDLIESLKCNINDLNK